LAQVQEIMAVFLAGQSQTVGGGGFGSYSQYSFYSGY